MLADILFNRALALKKIGNFRDAIRNLDVVIEEEPSRTDAWILKGNSYSRLNESEKSLECYDRALNEDPNNSLALENKIILLEELGRAEEAKMLK